jgi:HK97 family phage prohead protease
MIEHRFHQGHSGLVVEARSHKRLARVLGYAARFDCLSHDLGGFRETIKPGAFTDVLKRSPRHVFALFNHSKDNVIGTTANGTLRLIEDSRGLRFEVDMPDTTLGRDLLALVRRGDVVGASFACSISQSAQKFATDKQGRMTRVIQSISTLHDVSIVTVPAYPQACVMAQSVAGAAARCRAAVARMRLAVARSGAVA